MSQSFDPQRAAVLDSPERLSKLCPVAPLKLLRVAPGSTCFDLGSGTGFFTLPLARLAGKRGMAYTVNSNEEMMQCLLARNPPPTVRPLLVDATDTKLEDRITDFCLLAFVLHEVEQPGHLLSEAYRLLKDGGKLAFLEWQARETACGPLLSSHISLERAREILAKTGFNELQVVTNNREHYLVLGLKG